MTRKRDDDELVRDSAPTLIRDPSAVPAISMKADSGPAPAPPLVPRPEVKLRAISEVGIPITPPGGLGHLAPPRDPQARAPRSGILRLALAVVGVAVVVTVAVYVVATRLG